MDDEPCQSVDCVKLHKFMVVERGFSVGKLNTKSTNAGLGLSISTWRKVLGGKTVDGKKFNQHKCWPLRTENYRNVIKFAKIISPRTASEINEDTFLCNENIENNITRVDIVKNEKQPTPTRKGSRKYIKKNWSDISSEIYQKMTNLIILRSDIEAMYNNDYKKEISMWGYKDPRVHSRKEMHIKNSGLMPDLASYIEDYNRKMIIVEEEIDKYNSLVIPSGQSFANFLLLDVTGVMIMSQASLQIEQGKLSDDSIINIGERSKTLKEYNEENVTKAIKYKTEIENLFKKYKVVPEVSFEKVLSEVKLRGTVDISQRKYAKNLINNEDYKKDIEQIYLILRKTFYDLDKIRSNIEKIMPEYDR